MSGKHEGGNTAFRWRGQGNVILKEESPNATRTEAAFADSRQDAWSPS